MVRRQSGLSRLVRFERTIAAISGSNHAVAAVNAGDSATRTGHKPNRPTGNWSTATTHIKPATTGTGESDSNAGSTWCSSKPVHAGSGQFTWRKLVATFRRLIWLKFISTPAQEPHLEAHHEPTPTRDLEVVQSGATTARQTQVQITAMLSKSHS